jgi:hypothetical protein
MRSLASLLLVAVCAGCNSNSKEAAAAALDSKVAAGFVPTSQRVEQRVSQIATALTSTAEPICGTHKKVDRPVIIVPAMAKQCLSCQEAGFLLRHLAKDASVRSEQVWLVVPASETKIVCEYARIEHLNMTIVSMPDSNFDPTLPRHIAFAVLDGAGTAKQIISAPDGIAALEAGRAHGVLGASQ